MNRTWYAILITYMILFFLTGYINFISNNNFTTNQDAIAKITKSYNSNSPEKNKLVSELLEDDAKSYQEENNVAAQSFNVVLGSIISFLSATISQTKKN